MRSAARDMSGVQRRKHVGLVTHLMIAWFSVWPWCVLRIGVKSYSRNTRVPRNGDKLVGSVLGGEFGRERRREVQYR